VQKAAGGKIFGIASDEQVFVEQAADRRLFALQFRYARPDVFGVFHRLVSISYFAMR
jgi:hypothetical protein